MKKIFTKLTTLLIAVTLSTGLMADGTQPSGSGTEASPYQVATLDNLLWISTTESSWDKYFEQTADIDASATSTWNSNGSGGYYGFFPIGRAEYGYVFTGFFDGNNYTIDGLYINRSNTDRVGLFGRTGNPGSITNLGLTNVNITGKYTGGLIGHCYSTVSNCYTTGSVSGIGQVGGLCGLIQNNTISNCYSTATVTSTGHANGGLVGAVNGNINKCFSTGDVIGTDGTGGFIGEIGFEITVSDCYSLGNVSRTSGATGTNMGGFCGKNQYDEIMGSAGTIDNCYSIGDVAYANAANPSDKGFCGNNVGILTDNFFDSDVSNQTTGNGATAKTTAQMQTQSTFTDAGWDFTGSTCGTDYNWEINSTDNNGYPHLCWQVFTNPGLWTGATNTVWNTATNWDDGNVPTSTVDVTIPDVTNQPVIASGVGANCNNITINTNATLTINSGGSLITTGTITNNGTVDVKRDISDGQWHLISSPNSVATANVFDGEYLQTWDEANATWSYITEPTTALTKVKGYSL